MVLLGGSGLTVFHQEQALATMLYWPWIVLSLLKSRSNINFLPVFGALCGLALSTHYPHIHLIGLIFLAGSIAIFHRREAAGCIRYWLGARRNIITTIAGALLALAGALPSFYILKNLPDYSSPLRAGGIVTDTLPEYMRLCQPNMSMFPERAKRYLFPLVPIRKDFDYFNRGIEKSPDEFAPYVTLTGLAFALAAVIFLRMRAGAVLLFTMLSLWAMLGVHAKFAQFLFSIHFPAIGGFRQYYHFFPLVK